MLVYMDDILVTSNSPSAVDLFIGAHNSTFVTGDLGGLSFFLRIDDIRQGDGSLLLSQRHHITDLLVKANMLHCKPAVSPMSSFTTDFVASDAPPDPTLYRICMILMVKRILRYVKAIIYLGLLITPSSQLTIQAFSDADWAGSSSDRRSTGGYVVYLGPNLVSWQYKKQRTLPPPRPPVLWCENLGATYLSANPVLHVHTKHMEIDFHFVMEKLARKELQIQFISTKDLIANVLTKPLSGTRYSFRDKLRLHSRSPSACAGSIR
ncbi:hypothetical protein LIER_34774 [Lithospermum erythrorhizon]|uniref:Reverse transcriptase Ty1/copia-type domain-containing protein n=1 Tax=Lithospermum erythrorhizon TaxID=34254 RepID=A0AAV3S466_LITER